MSRFHRIARILPLAVAGIYIGLLCFPQPLFAHQASHGRFRVYAAAPIDPRIAAVLDRVETKLAASALDSRDVRPAVFLVGGFRRYAALSLYVGGNSFAKSFGALPTTNILINKADLGDDLVFRDAAEFGSRSLSGVIAHETAHLLVREHLGYWRNLTSPRWKQEGYAEYVAGGSTLPYDVGVKLWKERPDDATGYRYFRDYMLVKHLLEHEKISVDDLFDRTFDTEALADEVLRGL